MQQAKAVLQVLSQRNPFRFRQEGPQFHLAAFAFQRQVVGHRAAGLMQGDADPVGVRLPRLPLAPGPVANERDAVGGQSQVLDDVAVTAVFP